jgi:glycosyltransferase involved in cell wall biosynthesis
MADQDVRPAISVLTPCLDFHRFLGDALASVAMQVPSLAHVVQDGGSNDGTVELLRSHADLDWRSEPDNGQSSALNRAFARAEGDWIGWLNADEFYLPGALEALHTAALETGADLVYGDMVEVDEQGRLLRLRPQHPYDAFAMRSFGPHIASCAMLMRRGALPEQPWDERLRVTMDWDLYLTLGEQGARFAYVPLPVAAFRRHDAQVTASRDAWKRDAEVLTAKHGADRAPHKLVEGLAVHRFRKLTAGAYARQWRARALRGTDLRWFVVPPGNTGVRRLLARCYPDRARSGESQ